MQGEPRQRRRSLSTDRNKSEKLTQMETQDFQRKFDLPTEETEIVSYMCAVLSPNLMLHQVKTGQDRTRPDQTRPDQTRQDKTGQGKTRQDKTGQDKIGQDKTNRARQDKTRQDKIG